MRWWDKGGCGVRGVLLLGDWLIGSWGADGVLGLVLGLLDRILLLRGK